MSKQKKKPWLYRVLEYFVRIFYKPYEIIGLENLPDEPCAIVGNHSQLHGPLSCELYFPGKFYTWCAAPMMKLKEVPAYAYQDFWSQKPKILRPFYRLMSYLIAPLAVLIFNNARAIAVYRDRRIVKTFRESVEKMQNGNNVIIFPEQDKKHNNILYDFQEGFVDVARFYHRSTGGELSFVPFYIAPNLKKMYLGKPIVFSSDAPIEAERRRICDYLMNEITEIARNLPEHTVIPYRNIPKKLYPKNTQEEEKVYEKTGC